MDYFYTDFAHFFRLDNEWRLKMSVHEIKILHGVCSTEEINTDLDQNK